MLSNVTSYCWNIFVCKLLGLECTVLDDKNEPMITMDTPEEENADADYLLRCIIALYTFCPCWRLHQDFKVYIYILFNFIYPLIKLWWFYFIQIWVIRWVIDNFIRYKSRSSKPWVDGKMNWVGSWAFKISCYKYGFCYSMLG